MLVKYLFTFVDLFLGILTCYVCTRTDLIKEKNAFIGSAIMSVSFLASSFLMWR